MYMLAVDYLPLSTVEHTGFLHFCKKAVPLYSPLSRKTITGLLNDKYSVLKNVYKSRFQKLQNIAITTDIWTDVSVELYRRNISLFGRQVEICKQYNRSNTSKRKSH